jgi:UDP-hydrolysing UDP-N-acetyl-D-glucosamine 2-epimerase
MQFMRRICIVIGSRANYSSIKSVMRAIQARPDLELLTVVGASALLPRFGAVVDLIRQDGFRVDSVTHMIVEGETPVTMAKSTGLGLIELANIFANLQPDFVVTVGDRFETMATAIAAAYMNIRLAHTMGGEVTGTIDESVRHAVTKLAHVHFPANQEAAERIIRMGEDPQNVHAVGCPRIDEVARILRDDPPDVGDIFAQYKGVGGVFDLSTPFLLVCQHPVTTEYEQARLQMQQVLEAMKALRLNTILIWPNIDAGSDDIAKMIRAFRERERPGWLHAFINLPISVYVRLMNQCSCLIGNTSSAVREGCFIGVPAVNVGTRQNRRLRGANVMDVPCEAQAIVAAVRQQMEHGKYAPECIYGDGHAGERIAEVLATCQVNVQKTIAY